MKEFAVIFSFSLILGLSTFIKGQENKLPTDVTETIGEIVEAREQVESLGRLVVKYYKSETDPIAKQKYIKSAQLYGETRAAFKAWAEMVRETLIKKGKKGAEKELQTNPSFAERNRKAVILANEFTKQAEKLLYTIEAERPKGLFPFPTFEELKKLGIDIIRGIFQWKEYRDRLRKEYANEYYSRVEWKTTWEMLENEFPKPLQTPTP